MDNELVRLTLAFFALVRLVDFITLDDGPYNIFLRLRIAIENGKSDMDKELIKCPYCLGVWFALPVGFLFMVDHVSTNTILVILGLSGMQSILQELRDK